MPTLVIYRNGSLERQVELGERDLRIGRGDQNDVVLTDPAKSVSRFHAEVRLENGHRYIIDLNSQNGTWADGQRVQKAEMTPGVPVTMGPFALVLSEEAGQAVAPPAPTVIIETVEGTGASRPPIPVNPLGLPSTQEEVREAPPVTPVPPPLSPPPVAPPPIPGVPVAADRPPVVEAAAPTPRPPAPEPPKAAPPKAPARIEPPKPEAKAKPAKPPKPEKPAKPVAAKPNLISALTKMPKPILFGLFAFFVIAVGAIGVFFQPRTAAPPSEQPAATTPAAGGAEAPVIETNEQLIERHLREGKEMLSKGDAAGAIKDHFDRVLLINPDHPEALDLKMQAEEAVRQAQATPAATTPASGTPAAAGPGPSTPPAQVTPVKTPAQSPAATAKTPVPAGQAPGAAGSAAPPRSRTDAARARAGAVAKRPGEPESAYRARVKELQQRFQAGKSALSRGDYSTAVTTLEGVLRDEPSYPDASALLAQAQGGRGKAAQAAVDVAAAAEGSGDLPEALRQFQRAQEIDPAVAGAAEGAQRVGARMRTEGEDAYKRARQYDALGRASEAIAMYEKAVRYLPASNANAKAARDRLEALKK